MGGGRSSGGGGGRQQRKGRKSSCSSQRCHRSSSQGCPQMPQCLLRQRALLQQAPHKEWQIPSLHCQPAVACSWAHLNASSPIPQARPPLPPPPPLQGVCFPKSCPHLSLALGGKGVGRGWRSFPPYSSWLPRTCLTLKMDRWGEAPLLSLLAFDTLLVRHIISSSNSSSSSSSSSCNSSSSSSSRNNSSSSSLCLCGECTSSRLLLLFPPGVACSLSSLSLLCRGLPC